jgi:NAD(P)H dehydrogenase (quinone)
MTIAVTGATGHLGRLVVAGLKERLPGDGLLALARDPRKAADLGVPVRQADYARPETLAPALQGVDSLLLISSNQIGERTAQHRNVIEAARAAGVRHIAYTSLLRADTSPLSLAGEHRQTEVLLAASGLSVTVLRNGWYTENYTAGLGAAVARGELIGSAGQGRIASAARADYAAAAVAVLVDPARQGQRYELAGDSAWTLAELAAEASRQSGKPVAYRDLPEAGYAAALVQAGLPAPLAAAIASWDAGAREGALFDDGHRLSALIGRPTTPLAASVAQALAG